MLSLAAESCLADLIGAIADTERQIEIRRQLLANEPLFSPYAGFAFLDKLRTGYSTVYDIKDFLRNNGIIVTTEEVECLIELFGDRTKPRLYKNDFFDLILTSDPVLRSASLRRDEYEPVRRSAELALAKVFQAVVDGINKLNCYWSAVSSRYDYNVFDAFRTIDKYRTGYITSTSLSVFLKQVGYLTRFDDAELFIKFLDRDKDGRLSYTEFMDGLIPNSRRRLSSYSKSVYSESKSLYRSRFESPPSRIKSEYKPHANRFESVDRYQSAISPIKPLYESPTRTATTYISTPYKSVLSTYHKEEPLLSKRLDYYNPSAKSQLETELALIMEEQVGHERKFEHIKEELVIQSDFNLMNGFRIFDYEGKGFTTLPEFCDGLKGLGIVASYSEIELLFKRMDTDNDGKLKYSDYCFVFSPKRSEYEKIVIEKPPYDKPYLIEKNVYFSTNTRLLYKDAFEALFEHERALERIREKLKYKNLYSAFNSLDIKGKGQVSVNKVMCYIMDSLKSF